jgi:hypothetical protein
MSDEKRTVANNISDCSIARTGTGSFMKGKKTGHGRMLILPAIAVMIMLSSFAAVPDGADDGEAVCVGSDVTVFLGSANLSYLLIIDAVNNDLPRGATVEIPYDLFEEIAYLEKGAIEVRTSLAIVHLNNEALRSIIGDSSTGKIIMNV